MTDIIGIVFVCVAANHLGLVSAIEKAVGFPLPVVRCPKCFTFWAMMIHTLGTGILTMLIVSFLSAWLAIWMELCMGMTDKLYLMLYGTIYGNEDDEAAPGTTHGDTEGTLSELQTSGEPHKN